MQKLNNFDGGTNGVDITAGNSGGASGDAFGDAFNATFSTTNAGGNRGSLVAALSPTGGGVFWDSFTLAARTTYARIYFRIGGNPDDSVNVPDVIYYGTPDGEIGRVAIGSDRKLYIGNSLGSAIATTKMTNAVPTNQWVRVEVKFVVGTTTSNGSCELRLYLSADSSTATETKTASGQNFGTSVSDLGLAFDSPYTSGVYIDSVGISDVDWLGPATSAGTTVSPSAIASAEAFGTAKLNLGLSATGVASSEAFGTASIITPQTVSPSSVASSEAWGTAALHQALSISSIPSGEAWGTPSAGGFLAPSGIPSEEAWGSTAVIPQQFVSPSSIDSAEVWGTPEVFYAQVVSVASVESSEAFGDPSISVDLRQRVSVPAIASAEYWWAPAVRNRSRIILRPPSIQETPMARNVLHIRYGIHRGISILKRADGTYYQTRYPAQTEIEECLATYLGGHVYEVSSQEAAELTAAGYGAYLSLELAQ